MSRATHYQPHMAYEFSLCCRDTTRLHRTTSPYGVTCKNCLAEMEDAYDPRYDWNLWKARAKRRKTINDNLSRQLSKQDILT